MTATIGIEGSLTWANAEFLIAKINPVRGSYTENADTHDVTALGATATASHITGLRSATASFAGRFPAAAPLTGRAGNVVLDNSHYGNTDGDVVNLLGWSLDVAWPAVETTAINGGTAVTWKTYKPSVYTATGRIRCRVDDTEALIGAQSPGDAAISATLDIDGTNSFTGSLKITGAAMSVQVGQANAVEFPFIFTGAVTAVGANNIFAAGALPLVTANTLVVIAKTGRQYSGSAFPTRVGISVDIGSPIEVSCDAQYTGTVTPG